MVPDTDETLTTLRKTSSPRSRSAFAGSRRCGRGRAQHPERGDRVDVEHPLEPVVAHLVHGGVERVARVVDDDVQAPERVHRRLDERVGGALLGQVAAVDDGLAGDLAAVCSATSASRSLMSTFAPCADEQLGGRAADPARRPGDDGDLVLEDFHWQDHISPRGHRER